MAQHLPLWPGNWAALNELLTLKLGPSRVSNLRGNNRKVMTTPPKVGDSTTVTGANGLNSATINVGQTANFPAAGTALINGVDSVTYTGKGGTTLTGCGTHPAYAGGETVTITFGSATGITTPSTWPATSTNAPTPLGEHFTYHNGADPVQLGVAFPDFNYIKCTSLTSTNIVSAPFVISFYFEGTQLELLFKGQLGDLLVKVDDQYVSLTPTSVTATGTPYFMPITFATRDIRRIDVLMRGLVWGGVNTGPNDTIRRAETRGPRCIILGDSFTEGTGATAGASSAWTRSFQETLGWDDVWASGDGSTGYLSPGVAGRVKFRDRVIHDVIGYNPDVVVVQGGINDYATFTPAAVQAEALTLFQQILASVPNAMMIVLSPFWRGGASTYPVATGQTLIQCRDAIKAAAAAVNATFLDVLEMPFPPYVRSLTTTLAANSLAGAASVSSVAPIAPRSVIQIGLDRAEVKTSTGGGPYTLTLDGTLTSAHTSGDTVTQVGASLWTGTGRVGATSGYGNSDLMVSSDSTHPTQEGHDVIGQTIAALLVRSGALGN